MISAFDSVENIVGGEEKMLVTSILSFSFNVFNTMTPFDAPGKQTF